MWIASLAWPLAAARADTSALFRLACRRSRCFELALETIINNLSKFAMLHTTPGLATASMVGTNSFRLRRRQNLREQTRRRCIAANLENDLGRQITIA